MKILTSAASVALLVLCLGASQLAAESGPSTNGDFQFDILGATGTMQFNAKAQGSGAQGTLVFTGNTEISNEDVDGDGSGGPALTGVSIQVDVDCLRVNGNQAAMSGIVTSSTVPGYLGQRAVLAVEDGGEGSKQASPDRFTWGAYRTNAMTWTPEDAEVPGDPGWLFSWQATDFEQPDDVGFMTTRNASVDCKSFPLGAYAFEALAHGSGNINVKP